MSRRDLKEFIARHMKDVSPEREQLIAAVIHEGRRSSTRTVVFHAAIADRLGLNASDHKCADLICNETGPITAGRLAEITGLSTGAITGVVDRLERAGFVARVPDPSDRRRVVIQSTEHGGPDIRHLFVPMMESMATLCESYSNEELALIVGFMQRTGVITEAQISNLQQQGIQPSPVANAEPPEKAHKTPGKWPQETAPARKR